MKKIVTACIFLFLAGYSFGQDSTLLLKLHDVSVALGVAIDISIDTIAIDSNLINKYKKITEQQVFLLRAAECYKVKDYEKSNYYIKKVVINFSNLDLNNLKYVLLIGTYANLKNPKETARNYYIVNNIAKVTPENMETIRSEIGKNFKKDVFMEALSCFYYYHARLKIADEIKFND